MDKEVMAAHSDDLTSSKELAKLFLFIHLLFFFARFGFCVCNCVVYDQKKPSTCSRIAVTSILECIFSILIQFL